MSMYRKEWPCCGDVTETNAWEPESCPFCTPAVSLAQPGEGALTGWQSIETAPKGDETYILVWPPTWTGVASCVRWDRDQYAKKPRPFWRRTDDMGRISISRDQPPTHWMPLPEPPGIPKESEHG